MACRCPGRVSPPRVQACPLNRSNTRAEGPELLVRVAILGGGTIARLLLEHIRRGDLGSGVDVTAIVARAQSVRAARLAQQYGVAFVCDVASVISAKPDIV